MYKIKNWLIDFDRPLITNVVTNEEKRIGYHDHLVILILCENAGKISTKEELLKNAWPGKHVSEGSLTQSISAIRTLIEDDGKTQKHLKTVAKVGYKLESDAVLWQEEAQKEIKNHTLPLSRGSNLGSDVLANQNNEIKHKFNHHSVCVAIGCLFVTIAMIFPFFFATNESGITSWLPFKKIICTEHITVYSDDQEEAQAVDRGVRPLVDEKISQGKLERLILAYSDETISIVILRPFLPPINLVVLFDSPQSTESLIDIVKMELNNYVY